MSQWNVSVLIILIDSFYNRWLLISLIFQWNLIMNTYLLLNMVILLFFIINVSIHCWFTPWVLFTILRLHVIIHDFRIIHNINTLRVNSQYRPLFMTVPWYLDRKTRVFISVCNKVNVNWNVYFWVQIITIAARASTVLDYLSHSLCLTLWHSHCVHMISYMYTLDNFHQY